jgi:hypothetical protein
MVKPYPWQIVFTICRTSNLTAGPALLFLDSFPVPWLQAGSDKQPGMLAMHDADPDGLFGSGSHRWSG